MQKQEKIVDMFNDIAPTYDKANRILSFGIDIIWRKDACKFLLEKYKNKEVSIADIACGTGDMMGIWQDVANDLKIKIKRIIGIDPSVNMLKMAKEKFPDFDFKEAFADNTGLENSACDIVSISYGIRNVVARKEALNEFNRIIKENGYLLVLEFTKREKGGFMGALRDFYLHKILPNIGGFISKNKEAYTYLPDSMDKFLSKSEFIAELENSGFEVEVAKGYSFDISTLFIAKKIKNL